MSSSDLNVVTSVFSLSKSADRELSLASVVAMVVAMEDAMVAVACLNTVHSTRRDCVTSA